MAKDVVCGMEVDEESAAGKTEYQGKTYYFCSPGCKRAFDKNLKRFVTKPPTRTSNDDNRNMPLH